MSSDDIIIIAEGNQGYKVTHEHSEGGVIKDIGFFTNLRDAMVEAEEYQKDTEFGVEYGISFQYVPKERDATSLL